MMENDPNKRYQTAGGVAEDLRRYVNRFRWAENRSGGSASGARIEIFWGVEDVVYGSPTQRVVARQRTLTACIVW